MKKLFLILTMSFALSTFAHGNHADVKLENATTYHSVNSALNTTLSIGTHEGELHALIGDFGLVDVEKTSTGYETANKLITITTYGKNAYLEAKFLLFDRADYAPEKFEKEMHFHSYNAGFPHTHVDFLNKDYTEVRLQENENLTFKGKMVVNEETKDRIFTEEKGRFTIILFGKYDDKKTMSNKLTRTGMLILNMNLSE